MRKHKKNRGHTGQAVGSVTLRPRNERHGKPLTDVYIRHEVVRVSRGARINPQTGEAEMYSERKVLAPERVMTAQEIADARARVPRALRPTTKHGLRNVGGKEQPR